MAISTKNCCELELTEYVGMRATYELLNKTYRKNHRELEKANAVLNKFFDKFSTVKTYGEAVDLINRIMTAVCGSKRKAEEIYNEEMDLVASCKRRIEHLKEASKLEGKSLCGPLSVDNPLRSSGMAGSIFCEPTPCDLSTGLTNSNEHREALTSREQRVFVERFHRLLADHLFTEGYYKAALKLARETEGESLASIYEEAVNIQDDLLRGETALAHKWYQEANYKMKKQECFFEFDLRVFELYLLVRAGRHLEAIRHARKYLNSGQQADDYQSRRLGQAMVLLVMRTPEEVEAKAAQNELNEEWITKQFHSTLMNFYSFSSPTPFSMAVKAGVTAIKTHFCYNAKTRHPDCVVCHPLVNRLASNLPFGRHNQSVLTCYQTGLLMNDDSPPMALPNGYVYSEKALSDLATPDGMITCPRTGETCHISAAQRVYIL